MLLLHVADSNESHVAEVPLYVFSNKPNVSPINSICFCVCTFKYMNILSLVHCKYISIFNRGSCREGLSSTDAL